MGTLTVYRASAGSGKTFTLAVEYIRLLVISPANYRKILAVTFTNKATAEMKQRIISQLYGIGYGLQTSDSYLKAIQQTLSYDEEHIRKNARTALHHILHDFSFFHVETIDSFFQSVMRNLAHELQLSSNLTVELNAKEAAEEAVDTMLERLTNDSPVIHWILEAIGENIEENKNWNIARSLKRFALNLFHETYQKHSQDIERLLASTEFAQAYKQTLKSTIDKEKERMRDYAEAFFNSLEAENGFSIENLSYGKNGGAGYFLKLRNGNCSPDILGKRVLQFMESAKYWPAGKLSKADKETIMSLAESEWMELMQATEQARALANRRIASSQAIIRHFNELKLLNAIHVALSERNRDNNTFLLANTTKLLYELIRESDSPFIFEKLGTQLRHLMIDEFQDTSRMQWNNFRPLLNECLSTGNNSLIVGDIKQSIYRWRSGDWTILANMRKEVTSAAGLLEKNLDTNRRSAGNIIRFNNRLFHQAIQLFEAKCDECDLSAEALKEAYKDVSQKWLEKDTEQGYVKLQLIDTKSDENKDYTEETLSRLKETISSLLAQGVAMNSIAILVRYNKHIPVIASYFAAEMPHTPIVSAEAFRLDASTAVRLIIQVFTYMTDPENRIAAFLAAQIYQQQILHRDLSIDEICAMESPEELFPDAFREVKESLSLLPLYEQIERIIALFRINEMAGQEAFLFFFLDEVMAYLKEKSADRVSFLHYWEESLAGKTIPSGLIDGIRIHSIHASKGLEFDHVLIPFCDWKLETVRDILWCEPQVEPYNRLPIVPVEFTTGLKDSIFEEEYRIEKMQQWIDNINLLYVALTRPKYNLFIFGKLCRQKNGEVPTSDISGVLYHALEDEASSSGEQTDFLYEYGHFTLPDHRRQHTTDNPLERIPQDIGLALQSYETRITFRQSNKSMQLTGHTEEDTERNEYLQTGLILHRIFATLRTEADIEPTLRELEAEGIIGSSITIGKLRTLVQNGLRNPMVKSWFQPQWRVINECTILKQENGRLQIRRPDRVMIRENRVVVVDFKFGTPKQEYALQVREYMNLLRNMGYSNVEGYLWFVYSNNIEPVNL